MCVTLVAAQNHSTTSGVQPPTDLTDSADHTYHRWDSLSSLAQSVCKKIVKKTELRLFYKVEIYSKDSFPKLIQDLHENSIQTISISQPNKITGAVVTDHVKNMIFILDDVDQLLDVIFYTISSKEPLDLTQEISRDLGQNEIDIGYKVNRILPRFCIKLDQRYIWPGYGDNCTNNVEISSAELEESSFLSDSLFNATRGLHSHKIWNFRNHLMFILKQRDCDCRKSTRTASPCQTAGINSEGGFLDSLLFCFKFFWRFFKGRRTIICHSDGCKKYDAFAENIVSYQGETDDMFFEFSWKNMHKKSMNLFMNSLDDRDTPVEMLSYPIKSVSLNVEAEVMSLFEQSVNCKVNDRSWLSQDSFRKTHLEADELLKFGIDMISYGISEILPEIVDYSKYDYSISTDSNALCIATPHSAYMPQGLVIFQGFTPIVWGFVAVTIFMFCIIQKCFQHSQSEVFRCLYSDVEIDYYRDSSSLLTVYAYFICGNPPSLHLGRLFTGKILFLIFSFSALIISTLFLSGMTTLLSDRVLYPEIDSLKTLEMSDLFIQSLWTPKSTLTTLFGQLNQSEGLKAKLVDNMMFYMYRVSDEATVFDNESGLWIINNALADSIELSAKNIRSMAETDAFIVLVPFSSVPKDNLRIQHYPLNESFDYHLVEECLLRYPSLEIFMKGSFYFEKWSELTAQLLESGHFERILKGFNPDEAWFAERTVMYGKEPHAFDLNDLQSAFISLVVGLFLSFLVFLGEILTDHFQHAATMKYIRRLWNNIQRKFCTSFE
ncbi:unnamed protein product [Bemisia tabaci]|uniref:Ionotropic receptor n=1 Tax=Bemisia tabaci TaxID=7038 RepID=A0A9P0A2L3_BEMTA|nr:unnamed protein product [Bemisia tabaci]